MKSVCVLLNGPLRHDARVRKIIQTFSQSAYVDVFYIRGEQDDQELFSDKVRLHSCPRVSSFRDQLLRHTLFYREFEFFVPHVLNTKRRFDLIYANDLPTLAPAVQLKRYFQCHLVYDAHEIFTETLNQFFPTQSRNPKAQIFAFLTWFMRSMGRRAEASMLPAVDTFITASPFYADYFRKVYHRDHIEVMLNCPPLQSSTPVPGIDFHAFYDWPKTDAIALYQGVLNKGRGLELLIEAIAHADPTLKLVILGNGTLEPHLKALVERLHLNERIKFFGQVPHEKLLNHTVAADFGVNLLDGFNLSKQLSSTNKLYEYMHAGIPILASQAAENQRVFAEFDIGVLCDNHPPAIAAAMSQIMHSPQKEQWRHNARLATQKYNWEQQSQVLRRVLE